MAEKTTMIRCNPSLDEESLDLLDAFAADGFAKSRSGALSLILKQPGIYADWKQRHEADIR
jgi:hypothetical protein